MLLRAAVVGSTGLVGGHLLDALLAEEGGPVVSLVRRTSGRAHPRLVEVIVDFEKPETLRPHLAVDDVYCCLGTTMKKAGSQAAFRRVDFDYPLAVVREALAAKASRALVVTAVGSSATSSVFYNRVKGELERELAALDLPRGLDLFHPSLILGERAERRSAEEFAQVLLGATRGLFAGPLWRYRPIEARTIALAMVRPAKQEGAPGVRVHEGKALF